MMIPWQYSIKLDNGGIYVVQADTSEELGLMIEELNTKFLNPRTITAVTPTQTTLPEKPASPSVICETCGAKAFINSGVAKSGKPYKIQKCSKFPELQFKGGHSFWL